MANKQSAAEKGDDTLCGAVDTQIPRYNDGAAVVPAAIHETSPAANTDHTATTVSSSAEVALRIQGTEYVHEIAKCALINLYAELTNDLMSARKTSASPEGKVDDNTDVVGNKNTVQADTKCVGDVGGDGGHRQSDNKDVGGDSTVGHTGIKRKAAAIRLMQRLEKRAERRRRIIGEALLGKQAVPNVNGIEETRGGACGGGRNDTAGQPLERECPWMQKQGEHHQQQQQRYHFQASTSMPSACPLPGERWSKSVLTAAKSSPLGLSMSSPLGLNLRKTPSLLNIFQCDV